MIFCWAFFFVVVVVGAPFFFFLFQPMAALLVPSQREPPDHRKRRPKSQKKRKEKKKKFKNRITRVAIHLHFLPELQKLNFLIDLKVNHNTKQSMKLVLLLNFFSNWISVQF